MTPFEYVTVLISIILGLGITQIVTGIADLAHQWKRVKVYWPHLCWIIIVFFLHIQEWWATYELRNITTLPLPTFLFVLLYPINLFILARLLFPLNQPDHEIDLKAFYLGCYRKIFLWSLPLPILAMLNNVLITGHPIQSQAVQALVVTLLTVLITRKQLSEVVHKCFAVIMLIIMLLALSVMWMDALKAG